jgi:hypothetical protein
VSAGINARHLLPCDGTLQYPGCGKHFAAHSKRQRFCPECAALDKSRSFVFEERRRTLRQKQLEAGLLEIEADLDREGF